MLLIEYIIQYNKVMLKLGIIKKKIIKIVFFIIVLNNIKFFTSLKNY